MQNQKIMIIMPCYNKGLYISQAIESVLMQKTHFKFQLLIIDDLSTDDSYGIAMQYQKKHPELINIMKNCQNEGCLATTLKGYERIKSDYFCVLDPDDYWIDQDYLQNAINFLESHNDHTIYIANTMVDREGKLTPLYEHTNAMSYDLDQIDNCIWGHTSGTIFRNIIFKHGVPNYLYEQIATENEKCFEGDSFRNYVHLTKGKAYYSGGEARSVYRITKEGIWTKYSLQEQHLMNAQFYLLMLEYFKPIHSEFYIKSSWEYLLNYIKKVYSKENLNESIEQCIPHFNFDNLLFKCLKSFNLINDKNKIFAANFLFYLPSRIIGGYESLFIRLASFLSDEIGLKVYFIDFVDGIARRELRHSAVEFIDKELQKYSPIFKKPLYLIAPITTAHEVPKLSHVKSKTIFWNAHPMSIEWLSFRSGLKGPRLKKFLLTLTEKNSICSMDNACYLGASSSIPIVFPKNFVPVCTTEKQQSSHFKPTLIDGETMNIGWLGRLDSDKIYSLINLLDNLLLIKSQNKINVHIIGDGNSKSLIEFEKYTQKLDIIFTATLINDALWHYLIKNVDILFAMGISALEGASLNIPTVLVFARNQISYLDQFLWLFDSSSYLLGCYEDQIKILDLKTVTLIMILDEVYKKGNKLKLGNACYSYFKSNHSLTTTISKLIVFILNIPDPQLSLLNKIYKKVAFIKDSVAKHFRTTCSKSQ